MPVLATGGVVYFSNKTEWYVPAKPAVLVFDHDDKQKQQAGRGISQLQQTGEFESPIVTENTTASICHPAEDHHQCYLENRAK